MSTDRPRWINGDMAEPWHRDLTASVIAEHEHKGDLIAWAERIASAYGRSGTLEITALIWALLDRLDDAEAVARLDQPHLGRPCRDCGHQGTLGHHTPRGDHWEPGLHPFNPKTEATALQRLDHGITT